jgi:hypothetical protein
MTREFHCRPSPWMEEEMKLAKMGGTEESHPTVSRYDGQQAINQRYNQAPIPPRYPK